VRSLIMAQNIRTIVCADTDLSQTPFVSIQNKRT
jgi:hypothetical protein